MHIAIDARIINSSTGRYVERLLHYLQQIDKTNQYTVLVRQKDQEFWQPTNQNFTALVAEFDNYSFSEQTGYLKFLNKLNPDLVHFCMPQQPVLYRGRKVTTVHDLTLLKTYNSDKNWLTFHAKQLVGRAVFKAIAKTNDHIITPSKYTKNDYINLTGISPDKISVTYEAADVVNSPGEPYPLPFNQFIMYVGQQSDYKNIRRLGDAHQELLKTRPDLGLVLVGRLNKSAINNQAYFQSKKYKNVVFTDFIDDPQRDWLYRNTAAYIFPSLMEGFGLPGLEAMGYGAPVVASDATCLPEILGEAAVYFDPLNTSDMAQRIEMVLGDEKLRSQMIARGYKQVDKYSWRRMAEQTLEVYLDALAK